MFYSLDSSYSLQFFATLCNPLGNFPCFSKESQRVGRIGRVAGGSRNDRAVILPLESLFSRIFTPADRYRICHEIQHLIDFTAFLYVCGFPVKER